MEVLNDALLPVYISPKDTGLDLRQAHTKDFGFHDQIVYNDVNILFRTHKGTCFTEGFTKGHYKISTTIECMFSLKNLKMRTISMTISLMKQYINYIVN